MARTDTDLTGIILAGVRAKARQLAGPLDHVGPTGEQRAVLAACGSGLDGFRSFLPWWHFTNRETGEDLTFAHLWPGQEKLREAMIEHPWLFALKAGKLGFTELESAWDGFIARFRRRRAHVNIFSQDNEEAKLILQYVRYGLQAMPEWMRWEFLEGAGGDTTESLMLQNPEDLFDVRSILSHPAKRRAGIAQSPTHVHLDELSNTQFQRDLWDSVSTTVPTEGDLAGTMHIITRGAGPVYTEELWKQAVAGKGRLYPFFSPSTERPRELGWREKESETRTTAGFLHFAPLTEDDALAGDDVGTFIPVARWDQLNDPLMPRLGPGDRTPVVLGVDGAVLQDCFAVVVASRHYDPERAGAEVCFRASQIWYPRQMGGAIDYYVVENWLRLFCQGGCRRGHARSWPRDKPRTLEDGRVEPACDLCAAGRFEIAGHNVVEVAMDPHGMWDMIQRWRREKVAPVRPFSQMGDRYESDAMLLTMAMRGNVWHRGDEELRRHVINARARTSPLDDSKVRIEKAAPERKVDGLVAASMALYRCMRLRLA